MEEYDVIIIGGGAAGLTAGIYTGRDLLKTLVLDKQSCGGWTAATDMIENYPGFPEGIVGLELIDKIKRQAERFGAEVHEFEEVKKITKEKMFVVETDKTTYKAHAVIVASGSIPRLLKIPGEKEFAGKGVSYCAICDGALFKDKDIAVIGAGNSGVQDGEFLLKHVKSLTFVEFMPDSKAEKVLQERVFKNKKVKTLFNHQITAINGGKFVESITVKDRATNKEKKIPLQGVFVYIGFIPTTEFLGINFEKDKYGYIITNEKMETSTQGLFVVGDLKSKEVRQVTTANGEATVAAIAVRDYLQKIKENK